MSTPIHPSIAQLLESFPLSSCLQKLVVDAPIAGPLWAEVASRTGTGNTALAAGLWLYADDLDQAHTICQAHEGTPTFDFWHAILHRREGDFANAKYWFRRTGNHPALPLIKPTYNPFTFVDSVEKAHHANQSPDDLIAVQRAEWLTLASWCADNGL